MLSDIRTLIESIGHHDQETADSLLEAISILESAKLLTKEDVYGKDTEKYDNLPSRPSPKELGWDIPEMSPLNEREKYTPLIVEKAKKYGINPAIGMAVVHKESTFNPNAGSSKGAYGLMQLMEPTANELGVDRTDPVENVEGGMSYLAKLIKKFKSVEMGLAAYNSGMGNMWKAYRKAGRTFDWNKVKQNLVTSPSSQKETLDYVDKITRMANSTYDNFKKVT